MGQIDSAVNWIEAYLEWANADAQSGWLDPPPRSSSDTKAEAAEEFVAAYLKWVDAAQSPEDPGSRGPGRNAGRSPEDMRKLDVFREAVLLVALSAESDCMHILRQMIDDGQSNPLAVQLATEALGHAHKLLEDERNAWRALTALRNCDRRRSQAAWSAATDGEWPHAIETMAADVHDLTGKVLALQAR